MRKLLMDLVCRSLAFLSMLIWLTPAVAYGWERPNAFKTARCTVTLDLNDYDLSSLPVFEEYSEDDGPILFNFSLPVGDDELSLNGTITPGLNGGTFDITMVF
ncbi:MAG: hypothetical protein O7D91_05855 [Planctomycetota bacterium]|nr:hypothetical protein [Planctomycetota bacterium]